MRNWLTFMAVLEMAGCGGSDTEIPRQDEQSIFTSDVKVLVAENEGGGFAPPAPPGSECIIGAAKYTLTVASRQFDWKQCRSSGLDPYKLAQGSRLLDATEFKNLSQALSNLKVVKADGCGADKPVLTMTITTSQGTQKYMDSFYGCNFKDLPLLDTSAMDQTFSEFYALAMANP